MIALSVVGTVAGKAFGKVLKFLSGVTLKQWLVLGALVVLAFGQYQFHEWSMEKGAKAQLAIDQPIMDKLTKERNESDRKYKAYRAGFINWIKSTAAANKAFKAENDRVVAELELRLHNFEKKQTNKGKELKREIPKYIPTASLRNYDLPLGFIRLYDLSIDGEGTESATDGFLSGSIPFDVEAPSGIKLSEATEEAFIPNNIECAIRGEVIEAWQEWYPKLKDAYEKAIKIQVDTVPDQIPPPPSGGMKTISSGGSPPSAVVAEPASELVDT